MTGTGRIFSVAGENPVIPYCTVSGRLMDGVTCFSLGKDTDISAERYPVPILQLELTGVTKVFYPAAGVSAVLRAGQGILRAAETDIGTAALEDSIYLELIWRKENDMNKAIKAGEVFQLAALVPYQEGKIVNMDVVRNDVMKFAVMAFDEGCSLSDHAAPGDAIVFALEGEAVIGYEGKDHAVRAGQQFRFARGGLHNVRAKGRFKMGLLLVL